MILFLDHTCYKPYSLSTLQTEALGGTEATVVRIAEGLKSLGVAVQVQQHNRLVEDGIYKPISPCKAKIVVVIRDPATLIKARADHKEAKLYLWSHDLTGQYVGQHLGDIIETNCAANIVVSQYHKTQTVETLRPCGYTGQFKIRVIYNPIDNDLRPDNTSYDKHTLLWLASPHKGLSYALGVFTHLYKANPLYKLHVANPGYVDISSAPEIPGVTYLGPLTHAQAISELRRSLCLLHTNIDFPETFGLVYGEANAVGCPVLTTKFGASREVLDIHPSQIIDFSDTPKVIDRITAWSNIDRPVVRLKPQLRLSNVLKSWVDLISQG